MRKTKTLGSSLALIAGLITTAHATTLKNVSVSSKQNVTRVMLTFDHAPDVGHFVLGSPPRAVIDMPSTRSNWQHNNSVSGPRIKRVRIARHRNGKLRLVLDLRAGAYWAGLTRTSETRVVARIRGGQGGAVASSAVQSNSAPTANNDAIQEATYEAGPARLPAVVVVDPGHGGHDPGASGVGSIKEKKITLSIARITVRELNNRPGIKAVMTRQSDRYLSLAKRRRIAQNRQADLFVSIHANSYPKDPSVKGSAVYVLSRHGASNAKARQLARFENNPDPRVAGIEFSAKNSTLNRVLIDLFQNDAINAAYNLANAMLTQLGQVVTIYKSDPERANFAVLRDPLVPSVLVETAFLSNPEQARKLQTRAFQAKIADAIADGVQKYFKRYPPMRKYANHNDIYIVRAGDSLSEIAARNNTTIERLKQINGLDSTTLKVGQKLRLVASGKHESDSQLAQATSEYTVQAGDTLWSIANAHHTQVQKIVAINDLTAKQVRAGQTLTIPAETRTERIVVHSGDTLSQIARRHGTSIQRLKQYNGLHSDQIQRGQVLWLPTSPTRSS